MSKEHALIESNTLEVRNRQWGSFIEQSQIGKAVKIWLAIGLVMIFIQVFVGGITRLTGSGLSITKWEIVTGTLPPMNAAQWDEAFSLYKATPQYQKINEGMSMSEFKFIYFWEYIHRLWARWMGMVFLIPFLIFWATGQFSRLLLRRLVVVFLLAGLVASFGWIMVKSGLSDRPWVNAYKLTLHLSLALILFSYLAWTFFQTLQTKVQVFHRSMLKKWSLAISVLIALQIMLGGVMSGTHAGLFYPTWPDIQGEYLPSILFNIEMWNVDNFVNYDTNPFLPALIHSLHRNLAYLLTIIILWFVWSILKASPSRTLRLASYLLVTLLITQLALGILTLINCIGTIPVGLGVMHQAVAVLLLFTMLFVNYQTIDHRFSQIVDKYVDK